MATLSKGKDGRCLIYVFDAFGKRRKLSLGSVSKKQGQAVCARVEALRRSRILGTAPDLATTEWLRGACPKLRSKLVAIGLAEAAESAPTLSDLIARFLEVSTAKPSTVAAYKQCTDSLLQHLGADTPIDRITPVDADKWRAAIMKSGRVSQKTGVRTLAGATVAKRTNIAKAIFSKAKVWKLLVSSPFEHIKSGSQANPNRARYITLEETERLLAATDDIQWKAVIGICRYAGLRCPSELRELRWSDLDWSRWALTVRSPKTAAKASGALRIVPVRTELQPILTALRASSDPDAAEMVPRAHRAHVNLFQGFRKIVRRAGLEPWPRLLQNLRASCATDWASAYPSHESAKWLGHSAVVAAKHYLQSTDLHFQSVTGTAPDPRSTGAPKQPTPETPPVG